MLNFVVGPSRQAVSLHSGIFKYFSVPWARISEDSCDATTDDPVVIEDAVEDIFVLCVPIFVYWRLFHPPAQRCCSLPYR